MATTESKFHLRCEDLQTFQGSGIVGPFRLVADGDIELILRKLIIDKAKLFFLNRVLSRSLFLKNFLLETRWGRAKWAKGMHLVSPVTHALSTNAVVLDKIESIQGPNLLQWGSLLITQRPGVMHRWHVDADCLECDGITVWLPLKNVNEMTTMKVITRSHHLPVHPAQLESSNGLDTRDDNAVLNAARVLDSTCEMQRLNVQPGEFVIFAGRLWHSIHNRSRHPRSAILFQYAPTRAKVKMYANEYRFPFVWDDRPVPCCLVRGTDEYGRNPLVNPPTSSVPKPISKALSRLTLPTSM